MTRPKYNAALDAERRLALLKLILEDGGKSNERSLFIALRAIGQGVMLEQSGVRQLLLDLEQRMCVTTDLYNDTLLVAAITDRGRLVVAGDLEVDGIAPASAVR